MRVFQSRNPFTREVLATFDPCSAEQLESVISRSAAAFPVWRAQGLAARSAAITRLGRMLKAESQKCGRVISEEMGKPLSQAVAEVTKCSDCCDYYSQTAGELLAPIPYRLPGYQSLQVQFEPLGPLLLIMPFNFPFWMTFKTSIPHLLAGNTIVLKPAENTPRCAMAITELTTSAGLGDVFQHAFLSVEQVHAAIADQRVKGVSLTGSVRAGKAVAATAGANLKKCVLELGGSDPFIVFRDANVTKAAKAAVAGRLAVSGQVCISPKRFLVAREVAEAFTTALVAELRQVKVSDPCAADCRFGPLAREDLVQAIDRQVQDAVAKGAAIALGGGKSETHYDPTVLTNVRDDMCVMREETFGPLFPIRTFDSEEEAVRVANNTDFGLGAVLFGGDENRIASAIVPQIDAGMVFINDIVKSLVPVPFGGAKASGLGRELGVLGIREFTNAKTVAVSDS